MRNSSSLFCFVLILFLVPTVLFSQSITQKQINQQTQFWTSINGNFRINEKWGILADYHVRRTNFLTDPGFTLLRGAANYYIKDNMTLSLGYAHMWMAPTKSGWNTVAEEDRIYQQFQVSTKSGKNSLLQRIRNEQRWVDKIDNDQKTGERRFTNRVRYLVSYTIPVPKIQKTLSVVMADELALQFGKEIIYNSFEQNEDSFLGNQKSITPKLSFDFGYMNVYQQNYPAISMT